MKINFIHSNSTMNSINLIYSTITMNKINTITILLIHEVDHGKRQQKIEPLMFQLIKLSKRVLVRKIVKNLSSYFFVLIK